MSSPAKNKENTEKKKAAQKVAQIVGTAYHKRLQAKRGEMANKKIKAYKRVTPIAKSAQAAFKKRSQLKREDARKREINARKKRDENRERKLVETFRRRYGVKLYDGHPMYANMKNKYGQHHVNQHKRNVALRSLAPRHQRAMLNFPHRKFVDVNLTNNQKRRLLETLQNFMIQREEATQAGENPKNRFEKEDVKIVQHYPSMQGDIGRFDIYVNGIRLTEPISGNSNFTAPYLSGRVVPIGRNMNRNMNQAGWTRTMFEPYE